MNTSCRLVLTVLICIQATVDTSAFAESKQNTGSLAGLVADVPSIRPIVDLAVGGSTKARADSKRFVRAINQFRRESKRYQESYRGILKTIRDVLIAPRKTLNSRLRLTRGFSSYKMILKELEGAHLPLFGPQGVLEPLEGGTDPSATLGAIGTLLAAKGIEASMRRQWKKARQWFVWQVKFGGLVADSARTQQGLATGLSQVNTGLGLLVAHARAAFKVPNEKEIRRLRELRQKTGKLSRRIDRILAATREAKYLDEWVKVAQTNPSPMWRYEAIQALGRLAATPPNPTIRKRAVAHLKTLVKGDSQVARAANRVLNGWLKRVLARP